MSTPRPPAPMSVQSVATPIVQTDEMRMPAMITGSDRGSSTEKRICRGRIPRPVATSTTAENRQLANPVGTLSISCNASNQDVVSMGTVAARKAFRAVSNAKHILTVEVLADLQALYFRGAGGLGNGCRRIHDLLSEHFVVYDNGRIFHDELVKFRKLLFSSQLFDDLNVYCDGDCAS